MLQEKKQIRLGIVDDHTIYRDGLTMVLESISDLNTQYTVVLEAYSGADLINQLHNGASVDIITLDINMPEMDGFDTAEWLSKHYPQIKILALTMYDNDDAVVRMLKAGAKGYLLKTAGKEEFKKALLAISETGFYHSELISGKLLNHLHHGKNQDEAGNHNLTKREIELLELFCTDLTSKEIADRLFVSLRTIEGHKARLFDKLKVNSRVGLVRFAIRNDLIK